MGIVISFVDCSAAAGSGKLPKKGKTKIHHDGRDGVSVVMCEVLYENGWVIWHEKDIFANPTEPSSNLYWYAEFDEMIRHHTGRADVSDWLKEMYVYERYLHGQHARLAERKQQLSETLHAVYKFWALRSQQWGIETPFQKAVYYQPFSVGVSLGLVCVVASLMMWHNGTQARAVIIPTTAAAAAFEATVVAVTVTTTLTTTTTTTTTHGGSIVVVVVVVLKVQGLIKEAASPLTFWRRLPQT
jgi:hypothetical protein